MKRKRKEPVAGVSSRKFVGLKKSKMLKDVLKRPKMRGVARSSVERTLAGLAQYSAEMAKDRPAYGANFLAAWTAAENSVSACARECRGSGPGEYVAVNMSLCVKSLCVW